MTDPADVGEDFVCGGLLPVPEQFGGTSMYTCLKCGESCPERSGFFKACEALKQSDLEPRGDS